VNSVWVAHSIDEKLSWPSLFFSMGSYSFKNTKESQVEENILITFHFGEDIFHIYDPLKHCQLCKYKWSYESETWREEELYKRTHNYDEVIFMMGGSSKSEKKEKEAKEANVRAKSKEEDATKPTTKKESTKKEVEAL